MTPPSEPPDRFSTRAARDRLDKQFAFSPDPFMQDWDLERADRDRLGEFIRAYADRSLDDDDRFALMELIIASLDCRLQSSPVEPSHWQVIRNLLKEHSRLHASTIYSWCCVDAASTDECFPITPHLRQIWNEQFGDRGRMPEIPDPEIPGSDC